MVRRVSMYIAFALAALPAWAQAEASPENPFLQFLFGWFPLIVIILLWVYFIRRMGVRKIGHQIERSLEHMDRLESQTQEMLETLKRIERHLAG